MQAKSRVSFYHVIHIQQARVEWSFQVPYWKNYVLLLLLLLLLWQLNRMDARTYIHERWASRTWPANMFKIYICTQ